MQYYQHKNDFIQLVKLFSLEDHFVFSFYVIIGKAYVWTHLLGVIYQSFANDLVPKVTTITTT